MIQLTAISFCSPSGPFHGTALLQVLGGLFLAKSNTHFSALFLINPSAAYSLLPGVLPQDSKAERPPGLSPVCTSFLW